MGREGVLSCVEWRSFNCLWAKILIAMMFSNLYAQTFNKTDKLLIVVKGVPAATSMFGYSGRGTLYRSVATNSDGTLSFSTVAGAVDIYCERNSATDFTNKANYGTNGFIPPGIYFLHYHRLDISQGLMRHRLGLSDEPGGEEIVSDTPNGPIARKFLQFHVAFNDLATFSAFVSEGCITLKGESFFKLFPPTVFEPDQSPLKPGWSDPNPLGLAGATDAVLVFVTDALTAGRQEQQLTQFENLRKALRLTDFSTSIASQLPTFRVQWKSPPAPPSPPTGLQPIVK